MQDWNGEPTMASPIRMLVPLAPCSLLAALAWILLPAAAEYSFSLTAPVAVGAALSSIWCHARVPRDDLSRAAAAAVWVVSLVGAAFVPSPAPYWPAGSIFMWGLIGDPSGVGEALACVCGGGAVLVLYASGAASVGRQALACFLRRKLLAS